MKDIFERIQKDLGPLGQHADVAEGYYIFPKLTGQLGNRMIFGGKEIINWSINDYLGLANHPAVRQCDADLARDWGMAYPMGSRMMSGNTDHHDALENQLAALVQKESAVLLNFGYQGIMSAIDALLSRHDVAVYDANCHACIVDGLRMHSGHRLSYNHNNITSLEQRLKQATKLTQKSGGGILVISEGVFGMQGDQGKLKEIAALKAEYNFRFMVDDAHGFGTLGFGGAGAGVHQGIQDQIDVYFATFAKAMGSIGAFIAGDHYAMKYLKYNMRSQIFAKSLPIIQVLGISFRLQLMKDHPEFKERLWNNVSQLQNSLRNAGFNLGQTNSCVTPVFLNGDINEAMNMVKDLREQYGIFCSIVVYPVIPKNMILLRLIPTASHTKEDIVTTIKAFTSIEHKLNSGAYKSTTAI